MAENEEILPAAGDALTRRDMVAFGEWVDRSQSLCEKLLGNQVLETVFLARTARELGATAVSPFGAWLGGSVCWSIRIAQRVLSGRGASATRLYFQ